MTESLTTVALSTNLKHELSITEVAHMTGYNSQYLRRLEAAGVIPASHKIGVSVGGHGGTRAWYAHEVKSIVDYKEKKAIKMEKQMKGLYRQGNAARRKK